MPLIADDVVAIEGLIWRADFAFDEGDPASFRERVVADDVEPFAVRRACLSAGADVKPPAAR